MTLTTFSSGTKAKASEVNGNFEICKHDENYAYIVYEVSSGTVGGASVATTWTKRPLSSIKQDAGSIINSLSSSVISLTAGTYWVKARAEYGINAGNTKLRLRDTTNSTTLVVGSSAISGGITGNLLGRFTLSGTSNIELQYYNGTSTDNNDLGSPTSSGEVECYTILEFWKVD